MSDTDPEIEILETEVAPPPSGSPPRFRELVALALKTTDADVLDAAEHDYRGIHGGVDAFVRDQLAEHLQWLRPREVAAQLRGARDPDLDDRGGVGTLRGVRVGPRASTSAPTLSARVPRSRAGGAFG